MNMVIINGSIEKQQKLIREMEFFSISTYLVSQNIGTVTFDLGSRSVPTYIKRRGSFIRAIGTNKNFLKLWRTKWPQIA